MQVLVPKTEMLVTALRELINYKWQHGELQKRIMGIGQVLSDKPSFPNDPEDGHWPWYRIIDWKHYRIYLPRKKFDDNSPVCAVVIKTATAETTEAELTGFLRLLIGKLYTQ